MVPIPRRTFAKHLRELDREALTLFVADLWAARGWDARVDGEVVVATDRERDRRLTLAVCPRRRWRRSITTPERDDVDALVTDAIDPDTPESAARVIDAEALREMVLYALDAEARDDLLDRHIGRPASEFEVRDDSGGGNLPPSATQGASPPGFSELRLAGAAVGVLLLILGVAMVPAHPGLLGAVPADPGSGSPPAAEADRPIEGTPESPGTTAASRPDAASPTRTEAGRRLAPGVTTDGVADADALARAHEAAIENRSYRWALVHRQEEDGEAIGVAMQVVNVRDSDRYVSRVDHAGDFRTYPFPVAARETYADGTHTYSYPVETTAAHLSNPWADDPDGPAERTAAIVRGFLSDTRSRTLNSSDVDGRRHHLVVGTRPDDFWAENYSVVAVVEETGVVHRLRASYDLAAVDDVSVVVIFDFDPDGAPVVPPDWYREANGSTPAGERSPSTDERSTPVGESPSTTTDEPSTTATTESTATAAGPRLTAVPEPKEAAESTAAAEPTATTESTTSPSGRTATPG